MTDGQMTSTHVPQAPSTPPTLSRFGSLCFLFLFSRTRFVSSCSTFLNLPFFKLSQTGVALSPSAWHLWGITVVGKWGWVGSKIRNKVTSGVTTNTSILSTAKLYKVPSMSGISWLFQGFAELDVSACFCWDHVFYREMPCQSELVCVDLWANTLILERISKDAFWQFVCAAWGWDFKLCTKREMWNLACVLWVSSDLIFCNGNHKYASQELHTATETVFIVPEENVSVACMIRVQ